MRRNAGLRLHLSDVEGSHIKNGGGVANVRKLSYYNVTADNDQ